MNPIIVYILVTTIFVIIGNTVGLLLARHYGIGVVRFTVWLKVGFNLLKKQVGDTEFTLGWIPIGGHLEFDRVYLFEHEMIEPKPFIDKPVHQQLITFSAGILSTFTLGLLGYYLIGSTKLSSVISLFFFLLLSCSGVYYTSKFLAYRIKNKNIYNWLVTIIYLLVFALYFLYLQEVVPVLDTLLDIFRGNIKLSDYTNSPIKTLFLPMLAFTGILFSVINFLPFDFRFGGLFINRLKAMYGGYYPTNVEESSTVISLITLATYFAIFAFALYQILS